MFPPSAVLMAASRAPSDVKMTARFSQQINEAEGQAAAIMAVPRATAEGIRRVAIKVPGGYEAVQLPVAEQYIGSSASLRKGATLSCCPPTSRTSAR